MKDYTHKLKLSPRDSPYLVADRIHFVVIKSDS